MMARTSEIRFAGKPKEKRVAEELGALQQPGTSMVLVKAIKGGSDLLYDSFYLFHRTLRFPVTKLTIDELHGLGQRLLFSASALNAIFRLFKKSIETSRRSSLVRNSFFGEPICNNEEQFEAPTQVS